MCRARSRKAPRGHGCPLVVATSSCWRARLAPGHGKGEGVRVTTRPAILTFPGTARVLRRSGRAKPSLPTPLSSREVGVQAGAGCGMLWDAPQIVEDLDTALPCWAAVLGRDAGACLLCHSLRRVLGRRWDGEGAILKAASAPCTALGVWSRILGASPFLHVLTPVN